MECGKMLEKGGYVIKSLNTINFRKSMHYNPFALSKAHRSLRNVRVLKGWLVGSASTCGPAMETILFRRFR